jgi:hypothetical protein
MLSPFLLLWCERSPFLLVPIKWKLTQYSILSTENYYMKINILYFIHELFGTYFFLRP